MPVKQSKRYRSAVSAADLAKEYPLKEAVQVLAKFPKAKFDETVELSFRLGVDPAQGDQMVRGTTPLPNGSGKKVRVIGREGWKRVLKQYRQPYIVLERVL